MIRVIEGDCRHVLAQLEAGSVQTCVTSPPYFGLRDYGVDGQVGLEPTVDAYVQELVAVFREVRRVLRDDGTLWLNLGDSYASAWPAPNTRRNIIDNPMTGGKRGPHRKSKLSGDLKEKDLIGVPWMVAFALRADGWYLRSDIIWAKPNPMPESVRDRPTKSHEYLFLLTKNARYFYDADAIAEPVTASTLERVSQPNIEMQAGSDRVPGKTNGNMKAVVRAAGLTGGPYAPPGQSAHSNARKQDGHGRRHEGFNGRYFSQEQAPTRNARSVWSIATQPFSEAHFATFPPALVEPCIKAGSREGDMVLDPFGGAGTVGLVADRLGRDAILIELNPEYAAMARKRITGDAPLLAVVS